MTGTGRLRFACQSPVQDVGKGLERGRCAPFARRGEVWQNAATMLLQTNSYIVPPEKRDEHAGLMKRFAQILRRLGCEQFDVIEQLGPNWSAGDVGRCVQLMHFRDRNHQQQVQSAEASDAEAQALIAEFVELLDIGYQQEQGYFATGYYESILPGGNVSAHGGSTAETGEATPAGGAQPETL